MGIQAKVPLLTIAHLCHVALPVIYLEELNILSWPQAFLLQKFVNLEEASARVYSVSDTDSFLFV